MTPPRRRSKKNRDLPDNLSVDTKKNGAVYYSYIHPITKKKHHWGSVPKAKAVAAANQLNAKLMESENLIASVLTSETGNTKQDVLFSTVFDRYKKEHLPSKKIKASTLKIHLYRLDRLKEDLGNENIQLFTVKALSDYLDKSFSKDPYIKHRSLLIDVYKFAKRKGIYVKTDNPALETEPKNDVAKVRQRLDIDGYKAIYEIAPGWMQDAMDFALITLQGRNEVLNAKFDDVVEEHIHIIREKTKNKTEKAFIRIPVKHDLKEVISRARLRGSFSPYIISRKPDRKVSNMMNSREHWQQILPNYFTAQFRKLRDECGHFKNMKKEERPTFHEIRALGGDLYLQAGYSKEYVNSLYAHTTLKTTEIYLKGHRVEWSECEADLRLNTALERVKK